MSKPLDPFWQYGEPKDGTNRQNLKCKLCGHHMTEGISKLTYHLEKLLGHDLGLCSVVTAEIMSIACDSNHSKDREREERATNKFEFAVR